MIILLSVLLLKFSIWSLLEIFVVAHTQ